MAPALAARERVRAAAAAGADAAAQDAAALSLPGAAPDAELVAVGERKLESLAAAHFARRRLRRRWCQKRESADPQEHRPGKTRTSR